MSRRALLIAGGIGFASPLGSIVSRAAPTASPGATGEMGTVRTDQSSADRWHTVSLDGSYDDPVVIMTPLSYDGTQPAHVRLRNVQAGSFEYKTEEWEYLDGGHAEATAHYVVVEAGEQVLSNGAMLRAGTMTTDENGATVQYPSAFDAVPVLLTQAQTHNGGQAIVTRTADLTPRSFAVRLQEEEANGSHVNETVGWIAIDGTVADGFEAGHTADRVTDEWYRIDFERPLDSPVFVAAIESYDGPDPVGLRYRNLDSSGVEVFAEEERSADDETNHTTERVGYLAATPGELFGPDDGGGGDSDDGSDGGDDTNVIDEFDGGLAAYEGDTDQFTEQETVVASGTSAVECGYAGQTSSIGSVAGLVRYPRPGETFRVAIGATDAASGPRIGFATQGTALSSGRYQVYADVERDELYLSRRDERGWTVLASAPATISAGRWYDIEVQWTANNEFTVGLYPFGGSAAVAEVSAADDTYTSGGIQMTSNGRGADTMMYFDYWRVTDKTPTYGGGDGDDSRVENPVYASEHGGVNGALRAAQSGETVVVDGQYRERTLHWKSGVDLVGDPNTDSPSITHTDGGDLIALRNVSDIRIANVKLVGNGNNDHACIGERSPGKVDAITIENCTLRQGGNGVAIMGKDNPQISNVTVRSCDIRGAEYHGVIIGTNEGGSGDPTSYCENVVIEDCTAANIRRWMGFTLAGLRHMPTRNSRISRCTVDASMQSSGPTTGSGTKNDDWLNIGVAFEAWVVDSVIEECTVIETQKVGVGVEGDARRNVIRNNEIVANGRTTNHGLWCAGPFGHERDPTRNRFEGNVVRNPKNWAVYNKETGGDNLFKGNRFIGQDRIYNKRADEFISNSFR